MSTLLRQNKIDVLRVALSPALIVLNTTAEQTFTVQGLALNDAVWVCKPTAQAGLGVVNARVSAANTLAITFSNNTGSSITPTAAETYIIGVIRGDGQVRTKFEQ